MSTLIRNATIAASLCGAAFAAQAQTEFTPYGNLDWSYGRFEPSGLFREHRVNSNSLSATFVGANLKRGFDDGWTLGANIETFLRFQDLKTGRRDSDPPLSRNAFVSLASNYGTVRVGRLQTYLFDTTTRFNAFGNSFAASPAIRHIFGAGNIEGVQGDFYWNRAVSYTTPNWEGVTGNLMLARGGNGVEGDYAAGNVVISRGLLAVAISAQKVHINDGIAEPTDETTFQLGATYNFGLARVFGLYTQTQDRGLDVRSRIASAGVTVPLGPGSVLAQIGHTTATGAAVDRKHTSTSLGYVYPYDSRIDLYVLGMDDRIKGQTNGLTAAGGVRFRF
jgi:predicted porin